MEYLADKMGGLSDAALAGIVRAKYPSAEFSVECSECRSIFRTDSWVGACPHCRAKFVLAYSSKRTEVEI